MNPIRLKKLLTLLVILAILGAAAGLILYALRQNISLFYTPDQVHQGKAPTHQAIRVGGMVIKGSVQRQADSLSVDFVITDFKQELTIHYRGILPDLFREGQGVVVEGELLKPDEFKASRVLAKHDEKYMPPEVKSALGGRTAS